MGHSSPTCTAHRSVYCSPAPGGDLAHPHGDPASFPTPIISPREGEVLASVVRGRTNDEIAARLCVSSRTVQTHVRNLMTKTETRNRTHLVIVAIRLGLLPLPGLDELR